MIHPIISKILLGTVVYGIVILYAAASFQIYRKEKKSAFVLAALATSMLAIILAVHLARRNTG